jgi:hypothetical protein
MILFQFCYMGSQNVVDIVIANLRYRVLPRKSQLPAGSFRTEIHYGTEPYTAATLAFD